MGGFAGVARFGFMGIRLLAEKGQASLIKLETLEVKPTRAILEVVVGLAFTFFTMFIWYVTQPIVIVSIEQTRNFTREMGHNNTFVEGGYTILTWIEYWWGPILVIFVIVIWLYVSAQREEWRSAVD